MNNSRVIEAINDCFNLNNLERLPAAPGDWVSFNGEQTHVCNLCGEERWQRFAAAAVRHTDQILERICTR